MTPQPRRDHLVSDDSNRRDALAALASAIEGEVRTSHHDRMLYATDASLYQVEPLAVVIPRTIDDLAATVRCCAAHGLPLLPRGGGTSLAGQTVNTAVVIDVSPHCSALKSVNAAERTAVVEPGIVLDELNARLFDHRLMFGPDVATSSHACVGGLIGNNSSGAHSILYGRTVDHVHSIETILADGTVVHLGEGAAEGNERVHGLTQRVAEIVRSIAPTIRGRFAKTMRRVNGYNLDLMLDQLESSTNGTFDRVNLAHLICGSEGTLGVVAGAELRLVDLPAMKGLAIIAFPDVDAALQAVAGLLTTKPAAVELIDDMVLDMAERNTEYRHYVDLLPRPESGRARAVLYVEYFADDEVALHDRLAAIRHAFSAGIVQTHTSPHRMERAWRLRKAGEPLLHAIPGPRHALTFIEDLAVDSSCLPEFIRRLRRLIESHGTTAAFYAHASVGCLHVRPLLCLRDPSDRRTMETLAAEATDLVLEFGGALSGEHGDGRVRSPLLERFYGREICDAFRAIKDAFDPEHRLNPGNIVAPLPMVTHLRVRPGEKSIAIPEVDTYFNYDSEHGFDVATEQCNGAGVCRRQQGGTMCPSFRATRDERHSTRGRGNALRLAISGQFAGGQNGPAWNDRETLQTLDLCLSCKACKSECPSNVDMAKLKAEYLAQGYRSSGRIPVRARLTGQVRMLNRLGSAVHPVSNALLRTMITRRIALWMLGFDSRRPLPRFQASLYRRIRRRPPTRPVSGPTIVLFPDCFSTYNETQVGIAAIEVLEQLGYHVVVPRAGCCGRSFISVGMLEQAKRAAESTGAALVDCVRQHDAVAVVGCEPSCVSAITDDWPDLGLDSGEPLIASLMSKTFLIDSFIEQQWNDHPSTPGDRPVQENASPVLIHGHCHQKALWDPEDSARLLTRFAGGQVQLLDAGCCGLAGAFGHELGHYDLSMEIGELAMLPKLREQPEAIIAAPGASCRQQIRHATGRDALHPIEVVARSLGVVC